MENEVIIVGAGIAGLSCAITLAQKNYKIILVSNQASERSGSCMAEGGINAALDTYGEGDSPEKHFEDTKKNAQGVCDEEGIRCLTQAAPDIVRWLYNLGVQFQMTEDDRIDQRYFGGQKFRRTAYAGDSTGKQIMTALIDEARKYEAKGFIKRLNHHNFQQLLLDGGKVLGCLLKDDFTDETVELFSPALVMATGGYHGLFQNTTGAKADNGEAIAALFKQGVVMSNLEFIQFHPTTITNGTKRMLITEAARGEGARLCVLRDGRPYYFMEEKYPGLGNRMPRDITAREIAWQESPCYLDMTGMDPEIFSHKLKGLRDDCLLYAGLDPKKERIPVSPGIHYFMGGIFVDKNHKASLKGLYAAGECAACYHGANRLGGNSLLGAAFGGKKAAETIAAEYPQSEGETENPKAKYLNEGKFKEEVLEAQRLRKQNLEAKDLKAKNLVEEHLKADKNRIIFESQQERAEIAEILNHAMGIIRNEETLHAALAELENHTGPIGLFARALVSCALNRRESRGAHYRSDFMDKKEAFDGATKVTYDGKEIHIEIHHFH